MKAMKINTKRLFSSILALMMVVNMVPPPLAFAAETDGSGLCPHHIGHTEECGYIASSEGQPCQHVHDDTCGYVAAAEETPCNMECVDTDVDGVTDHASDCAWSPAAEEQPCQHVHDKDCGYAEANLGKPCGYVCTACAEADAETNTDASAEPDNNISLVQKMIDVLPDADSITKDNAPDVKTQLTAIDDAKNALSDEELDGLDITRYEAAVSALLALEDMAGADQPQTLEGDVAQVTIGGTTTNYTTIEEAWAKAQEAERATIMLQQNTTTNVPLTMTSRNIELYMPSNCVLTAGENVDTMISVEGGRLNITGDGELQSPKNILSVSREGKVLLTGCVYTSGANAINCTDCTIGDLLSDNYRYVSVVDGSETQVTDLSQTSLQGKIKLLKCNHPTINANGCSQCGVEAKVVSKIDGETKYYTNIYDAFWDARLKTADITLLKTTTTDCLPDVGTGTNITLNMPADVTLTFSDIDYSGDNWFLRVGNGTFTLKSGIIESPNTGIVVDGGTANICGGTIKGGQCGLNVERGTAKISGGTFIGGSAAIRISYLQADQTIGGLLEGCTFQKENGDSLTTDELNGQSISGTVEAIPTAMKVTGPAPAWYDLPLGYTSQPTLTVTVKGNTSDSIGYQWYEVKGEGEEDTLINGATSNTYTVPTGLGEGTHKYRCVVTVNGTTVNSDTAIVTVTCLHSEFNEDGECTKCGKSAPVQVTVNDSTTYYTDIISAWSAASDAETAEIMLRESQEVSKYLEVPEGANLTLKMGNGAVLSGGSDILIYVANSGKLTMEGCTLSSDGTSLEVNGTVNITECNISSTSTSYATAIRVIGSASMKLYGGTSIGVAPNENNYAISIIGSSSNLTVGDLLGDDYAYMQDGQELTGDALDAKNITGTVNVVEKPTVKEQPVDKKVYFGTSESISVAAKNPNTTYQWYEVSDTPTPPTETLLPGKTTNELSLRELDLDIGTYKFFCRLTLNDLTTDSDTVTVTVGQSGTDVSNLTVDHADKTYTYGGTINVTATADPTGNAPNTVALNSLTEPTGGQMALYFGGTQVSVAADKGGDGNYHMTASTVDVIAAGAKINEEAALTAKYKDSSAMAEAMGTVSVTIKPKALTISGAALADREYDTTKNATVTRVDFGGLVDSESLILDEDYTATAVYEDGNVGTGKTAAVTVELTDKVTNYILPDNNTCNATGNVTAKVVTSPTINLSEDSFEFDGGAKKPAVTSVMDGTALIPDTEYTVGYSNNINVGTADTVPTVIITDKSDGNYTVNGTKTFTITPKSIAGATANVNETFTYNGKERTPGENSVEVKLGEKKLTEGTDYTLSYGNNMNAGTATVTVTGKGNYKDAATNAGEFTIEKAPLSFTATLAEKIYDGKTNATVGSLDFSGLVNGENLTPDNDYTVTAAFTDPNVGTDKTATVTVKLTDSSLAKNYRLTTETVTLTNQEIKKADSEAGSVTADKQTLTYGDSFTVTATGIGAKTRALNKLYLYDETGKELAVGDVSGTTGTATYDTTKKLLAPGTHTLKVAYGGSENLNENQSLGTVTVTLNKAPLSIGTVTEPYKGANVTKTVAITDGVKDGDSVSAEVTTTGKDVGSYSIADKKLTVSLTGTGTAFYEITGGTLEITKAQLEITGVTLAPKTYDGSKIATVTSVTLSGLINGETLDLGEDKDYTATAEFTDENAGTGKTANVTVTLKNTETANNYTVPETFTKTDAEILKAELAKSLNGSATLQKTEGFKATVNLSEIPGLGAPPAGQKLTFTVHNEEWTGLSSVEVDGDILTLTANSGDDVTGPETVIVKVSGMQNYTDKDITITVNYTDKLVLTIGGVKVANKTYDNTPVSYDNSGVYVDGLAEGKPFTTDKLLYAWYDSNNVKLNEAPKNAGDYSLKVSVPEDDPNYTGEQSFPVSIGKATITVQAKNKFVRVGGGSAPVFTSADYTVTGLVGNDTPDSVNVNLSFGSEVDLSKAGQVSIIVEATPNNNNYTVMGVNGILYIRQSGAILFRDQRWVDDVDKSAQTFYYNINQPTFTITGTGDGVTAQYILSDTAITDLDNADGWIVYNNGPVSVGGKAYIAVRITSGDGSYYYLTSPKLKLFTTTPVITGVTNGTIYCAAPTITVTNANNITVNGTNVMLDSKGQYTLQPLGKQTISATDEAGNSVSVTVTVNNGHDFESETVESNCVQSGITKNICKVCGYEETTDLGTGEHRWETTKTVDKAPTCTEPGSESYHCSNCNATDRVTEISATGHNIGTAWKSDSTNHWHTCTICGAVIESAKHLESEWETESNGTTQKKTCITCEKVISQREIISIESTNAAKTTVEVQISVESGAPETDVQTSAKELWDSIIPETVKPSEEQKQFDVDIKVNLKVKPIETTSSTVQHDIEAIKAAVQSTINADAEVKDITFMDISLTATKTVDGVPEPTESIKKTVNPLTITITIPDNLRNYESNIKRTFSVFRCHEGETPQQVEGNYEEATGKFTFASDKFSTYAIAYKDEIIPETPVNPNPGIDPDVTKPNSPSVNPGGSSGGGSSGGGGSTIKPKPATIADINVSVVATTKDGTAASAIDKPTADKMVADAVKHKSENVNVKVNAPSDAASVTVTIPSSSAKNLADKTNSTLNVETPLATVVIPNDAVGELSSKGKDTVGVTVEKSNDDVKITIQADSKDVGTLSGVKASIPTDKTGSGNVAVIMNPDGTETVVKKAMVKDGRIVVPIGGSATVRIADRSKSFDDTNGHWANDSIGFVTSRDLFNGVSETEFAPNAQMTRAMLVTVLHRLEDNPESAASNFEDVPDGTWYTDAVAWAAANSIVNGKSANSFAPNDSITREQLAAILYRYAKNLGMDTSVSGSLTRFSDANTISSYATEAVTWVVGAGIINGKTSTTIDPQGDATRAEVSTMLMRLVGVMNTDTSINTTDIHA